MTTQLRFWRLYLASWKEKICKIKGKIVSFKSFKIGKYTIEKPIIQGGMGVGISWDRLAGTVSKEGGLGVISSVGTGVYKNRAYAR